MASSKIKKPIRVTDYTINTGATVNIPLNTRSFTVFILGYPYYDYKAVYAVFGGGTTENHNIIKIIDNANYTVSKPDKDTFAIKATAAAFLTVIN